MFITRVDLENIKSHTESSYEFRRGTTAIIGENGAGKTTLIEAVAWTLFDLLDYKKDAFVTRGAKRGVARVSFESAEDERTYVVHRDTGTGYYVYDPQLNTRVADKKDEVQRFLRHHMKVEAGTDLEALFRSAIGVPQGTFTSIFLETPTERKRTFDKLLKVEEYRRSSDRLIDTVNYIKQLQIDTGNRISFAEGKLENYSELQRSHKLIKKEAAELAKNLKAAEKDSAKLAKKVAALEKKAKEIATVREEITAKTEEISRTEVAAAGKEAEVKASREASERLRSVEKEHREHVKALGTLEELERERHQKEKLSKELAEVEAALVNISADRKRFTEDLERILKARKEFEELKPKIAREKDLEQRKEEVRNRLAAAESAKKRSEEIERDLGELRKKYREAQSAFREAENNAKGAELLPDQLKEDDRIRERIAELEGRLEVDRRFQSEVRNGLCPILSEKCLNLKEGETLEGYLSSQFKDLTSEIASARATRKKLAGEIAAARKAEGFAAKVAPLRVREEEIAAEGKRLRTEKEELDEQASDTDSLKKELEGIETDLRKLESPSAKARLLEKDTAGEINARERITKVESNFERLESDRKLKSEQLDLYKDLEMRWKAATKTRDSTAEAQKIYLANEKAADLLEQREKDFGVLSKGLEGLQKDRKKLETKAEKISGDFDQAAFESDRAELSDLKASIAVTSSKHEAAETRKKELEQQIESLKEIRETMKADKAEKERLEKLGKATAFIRTTLKSAAPRVAQNYVYHVSIEANRLFREITGNMERTLKWENDYGIALEDGGYDRPFQNLSGGEQMAAALAVRLALLRQLSDIKLAFFDEPTTNLDLERRERLAEQISQITESRTFDQLFVISHDDTFEGYVDNVIEIEGVSQG